MSRLAVTVLVSHAPVASPLFSAPWRRPLGLAVAREAAALGHAVTVLEVGAAEDAPRCGDVPDSVRCVSVAPPPVLRGTAARPETRQEWQLSLVEAIPPSTHCVLDATGPDTLALAAAAAERVYEEAAAVRALRETAAMGEVGEEHEHGLGRSPLPIAGDVALAIGHAARRSHMLASLRDVRVPDPSDAGGVGPYDGRTVRSPQQARQADAQAVDEQGVRVPLLSHPLRAWFLSDWRMLDIPAPTRPRTVGVRWVGGPEIGGSGRATAVDGIVDQYLAAKKAGLKDWSLLCLPPLRGFAPYVGAPELPGDEADTPVLRSSVGRLPWAPKTLEGSLPHPLLGVTAAARVLQQRPSLESVALFLAANLETRWDVAPPQRRTSINDDIGYSTGQPQNEFDRWERPGDVFPYELVTTSQSVHDAHGVELVGQAANRHYIGQRVGLFASVEPRLGAAELRAGWGLCSEYCKVDKGEVIRGGHANGT